MKDQESTSVEAELSETEAAADIAEAVSARHSIARKYVLRLRRKYPEASPGEIVRLLERRYMSAISTAGAIITVGTIAADVGISMIPIAGQAAAASKSVGTVAAKKAASEVGKAAAKSAAKEATKSAAKGLALGAAKGTAQKMATLLPAGDKQVQFEITAVFALAIAEVHGKQYDRDQAHALVYGLSNERVSQQQIAAMASDLAASEPAGVQTKRDGRWADTLADALPGGAAQGLVRTMQTGQLDEVRDSLGHKQRAAVDYGIGAVSGGITRFVFGREVVEASRAAFADAPEEFPDHLALVTSEGDEDDEHDNRAIAALEGAAKATTDWISDSAGTVGTGIAASASAVGSGVASMTRAFRSVDLDGDGVPDEAQAITAAKNLGGALSGAADAMGGRVKGILKRRKRGAQEE